MYMQNMIFVFFLARCSPAAECFFSQFRPRGKLACRGYIMNHVWISAELRGRARRIKRRLAGSISQGILRSASLKRAGHLEHPKLLNFDFLMNFYIFFRCFVRTKCLSSSTAAVAATTRTKLTSAAAQQQQ